MSDTAMIAKYEGLTVPVLGETCAKEILSNLQQIETVDDLRGVIELMAI